VRGKLIEIAGIKSYERLGEILINGKPVSVLTQTVPADGKLYSLQGMRLDGNASEDPEIRQAFASFRFIERVTSFCIITYSPSPSDEKL